MAVNGNADLLCVGGGWTGSIHCSKRSVSAISMENSITEEDVKGHFSSSFLII